MQRLRKRLTYANVMSSLAVFLVLGGATAFAAGQLGKNSVGTKQLKKNAVTAAKIKKEAVTGAKVKKDSLTGAQIKESTLGTVPSATSAASAGTANSASVASSLTAAEGVHVIGAAGQPGFEGGAQNYVAEGLNANLLPAGFWKDKEGVVHLQGIIKVAPGTGIKPIFTLPPGFRPPAGTLQLFSTGTTSAILMGGSGSSYGSLSLDGKVVGELGESAPFILFEGVTFRAGS